jgi:mannosyltransferase
LRYSGVTATNRLIGPRLAPVLKTAWLGSDCPDGVARIGCGGLWRLRRAGRTATIWHARRNVEMIAGLLLKRLGWPFALVFTSAAQRQHTRLTRWLIARMDAVIATSEAAAARLQRPATVIHHGIDTAIYCPPADRAVAWRDSGLPGRYGIGCFGRVRPQKGTDVFVAAMCRLLPRYPDFTAIIIGEVTAQYRGFARRLQDEAASAGLSYRIRFFDYLPIGDVPRWYQRILIYAFTSRNEGFGLTLLEATAAGTAVVAARAGAADVVIRDGDTGVLVPPSDVEALVAALEPLMRDPARAAAMGERARAQAVAEFSVAAEAEAIAKVYRTLWQRTADQ